MSSQPTWEIEVRHEGLKKYRHIRGKDKYVVEHKANAQLEAWEEMWKKKQEAEQKKEERERAHRTKEKKIELAATKTAEAEEVIKNLESTLLYTLAIDDAIDWRNLLNKKEFGKEKPFHKEPEPKRTDKKYQPKLGILDRIIPILKRRKEAQSEYLFETDRHAWVADEKKYRETLIIWQKEKEEYELKRDAKNKLILEKEQKYFQKDPSTIADYCEMVLSNSEYPDYFPQEWDLEYLSENKILIVDYSLPDIDNIPKVKSVKYIASRDEFKETYISDSILNKLYDNLLYQIVLRTIHELYEADKVLAIDSIVLNGWVNSIDRATGHNVNSCIMSVQASRNEFISINLVNQRGQCRLITGNNCISIVLSD